MKPNYFTIHKNKKPKRLFRKKNKPNPHTAIICLLGAMGAFRISTIQSNTFPIYGQKYNPESDNKEQKKIDILDSLVNTSSAIIKELKKANYFEFKRTGKYKRINKKYELDKRRR